MAPTSSRARRLHRTARRTTVSLVAVTALALLPWVAHADSWSHTDPARDVESIDPETDETAQVATRARGDIRRVRIAHRTHRVTVRFRMRKALAGDHGIFYRLRTPRAEYDLTRLRFDGTTRVSLTRGARGKPVRCSRAKVGFSKGRTAVTASMPRGCLGDPRWIRVGAGAVSFSPDGLAYWDDGLHDGDTLDQRLSRRLRRG